MAAGMKALEKSMGWKMGRDSGLREAVDVTQITLQGE
jgi:hypothetical protein